MAYHEDDGGPAEKAEREATAWFVRLNDPMASDQDRRAFQRWLGADPAHGRAMAATRDLWDDLAAPARTLSASHARPQAAARRAPRPALGLGGWLRRAGFAGAVMASLAAVAVWRDVGLIDRAFADYATRPGERLSTLLQDGTRLQLDGDTAIRTSFTAAARDVVVLRGRVWFEVAPDPSRPFTAHAGDLDARAIGTAFEVDVAAGSVAVGHGVVLAAAHGGSQAPVRLAPGERVELRPDGRLGAPEAADPSTLFAWRRGLLVLDAAPLRLVADELGRMTAGRVVFAGPGIAEMRLSGTFSADEPEAVLAAMRSALGLKTATAPGLATVIYR